MTAPSIEARPLAGLRVIDLTHVIAGPFATHQLAALGADVVKVESPDAPDMARGMGAGRESGMGAVYRAQGAGKRAVTLDLAAPAGRAGVRALLSDADVLVENWRPGALTRHGLDYAALSVAHPRLIYCSITGYGQDGPAHGAYDNVIQASSGLMALNGGRIGAPVVDYATGLTAAFAIMAALAQRARDGRGQHVDVAMQDVALTLAGAAVLRVTETGEDATPSPAARADGHPGLGTYDTADGALTLGALTARQLQRLGAALGAPSDVFTPAALATEAGDRAARLFLLDTLPARAAVAWEALLNAAGVPARRVRRLGEAAAAATARGLLAPVDDGPARAPVAGFRLSRARLGHDLPAPIHGAQDGATLGTGWRAWDALRLAHA